jgi:dihydrofolate reductase
MPLADRLEVTHIHAAPAGDTVFPPIDPAVWRATQRTAHAQSPGDDTGYEAVTYVRVRPEPAVRDAPAR